LTNTKRPTFRIETLVLGRWVVASRGVSRVEALALAVKLGSDPTTRIVPE
jgi:hypothetical protein